MNNSTFLLIKFSFVSSVHQSRCSILIKSHVINTDEQNYYVDIMQINMIQFLLHQLEFSCVWNTHSCCSNFHTFNCFFGPFCVFELKSSSSSCFLASSHTILYKNHFYFCDIQQIVFKFFKQFSCLRGTI